MLFEEDGLFSFLFRSGIRVTVASARGLWRCCSRDDPAEAAVKYLDGPGRWPGRARVLALGCCAGPHGRVVAGNILSEVTALSGQADPWWVLAGGRQVPSESVARRSRHVRRFEWRVGPMCRADCGRWWPAKLCVQPGRSKSVSAPRGPLRAAMSGVVCRAIARARVSRRPGAGPRPSPRQRRASGAGVRERTWGPWFGRLPAASTRATEGPVQPAVGGLSTTDCSGWCPSRPSCAENH
jgi:hypothetical protein